MDEPGSGAAVERHRRGLTPTSRGWPAVALLFTLVLVGHDLMMTSPEAHAAPEATTSTHAGGRDHAVANMAMSLVDWSATAPHGVSSCPVNRVAKAPSIASISAGAELDNAIVAISEFDHKPLMRPLPGDSSPPLTASARRAFLQVFLM